MKDSPIYMKFLAQILKQNIISITKNTPRLLGMERAENKVRKKNTLVSVRRWFVSSENLCDIAHTVDLERMKTQSNKKSL